MKRYDKLFFHALRSRLRHGTKKIRKILKNRLICALEIFFLLLNFSISVSHRHITIICRHSGRYSTVIVIIMQHLTCHLTDDESQAQLVAVH